MNEIEKYFRLQNTFIGAEDNIKVTYIKEKKQRQSNLCIMLTIFVS